MSWVISLDERWPVSVLERVGAVASEFPGDDELILRIGERELTVPVEDCEDLRSEVKRVIREEAECEL